MPLPFPYDFRKPDYGAVYEWRIERLQRMRTMPEIIPLMKEYYKEHIAEFIMHWGMTYDPRNADIGLPSNIPFLLFEIQEQWLEYAIDQWRTRQRAISEKSRDMGLSWLSVALASSLCLFNDGMVIGFGSRKEEYVDKADLPKSIFWKIRYFLGSLPIEFRGGFDVKKHSSHMKIQIPETKSYIVGEAGDNIGRGDRTSIYFVDEASHIQRAELNEASLSATTNARHDISSCRGMSNTFAEKRWSGKYKVFTMPWRSDPRKDNEWYEKFKANNDPVVVAQEVDIDYRASVEGVVIPYAWVESAVDAAEFLGVEVSGIRRGALDIADEGKDKNAFSIRHGIELQDIEEWSGKGSDTLYTTEKTFLLVDKFDIVEFDFDTDGIGTNVRGDARMINERRLSQNQKEIEVMPFRGSGAVVNPESEVETDQRSDGTGRTNKDFFANMKAQGWWHLRFLFQETYRAVEAKKKGEEYSFDPDNIISLSSNIKLLAKLKIELSQPTYKANGAGKIIIDKAPKGMRSPNLSDSVMMNYAPKTAASLSWFDY